MEFPAGNTRNIFLPTGIPRGALSGRRFIFQAGVGQPTWLIQKPGYINIFFFKSQNKYAPGAGENQGGVEDLGMFCLSF